MNLRPFALALFSATLSCSALAAQLACPDLAAAVQVNACPTEEELKFTYTAFCSDNAKAYARETDSCLRYQDYRQMKNTALWEAKDGEFSGYISCDLSADKVKASKATGMKVERQGKLTKVVCSYPGGVNLSYRTKEGCAVDNDKACSANVANCRATCN